MSAKTKIIVLHMKEIVYTVIFLLLAILFIILIFFMFRPDKKESESSKPTYLPGTYTSTVTLNNTPLEVEVTVDESHINSIRFANLDESITAMYPLIQPAIEELAEQIYKSQSLEHLSYSNSNPYTSQILVRAVEEALKKATAK